MATMFYDQDADLTLLHGRKIAVIGFGSQGHAHALNLKDSGCDVMVGLYPGSKSWELAEKQGLRVTSVEQASKEADIIMILAPDHVQKQIYTQGVEPYLSEGNMLMFAHGFNINFQQIQPPDFVDVTMVAPKGPGHLVRSTYTQGGGVPSLIAIFQNPGKKARDVALSYAAAIGAARAGVIETSFREECETDLFGEQVVLCGGVTALIEAGFETLVNAGYAPEMAYFECVHEVKLIVDLIYEGGIANMRYSVSNTAEYGDFTRGPRIVNEQTRAEMKKILAEIQTGQFAKEFILEHKAGAPTLKAMRRIGQAHQVETVGAKLRDMMPWIKKNKLVDQAKN